MSIVAPPTRARSILAASPSDLDLCAVHVLAHPGARGVQLARVARGLGAAPQLVALRDRGYLASSGLRGPAVVVSAVAPGGAALEVAEALTAAVATAAPADVPAVDDDPIDAAVHDALRFDADAADEPRSIDEAAARVRSAPRSVVLVAPRDALPEPTAVEALTVAGSPAATAPEGLGAPTALALPGGDRIALEVVTLLGPPLSGRDAFVHAVLSAALAGHHASLVTTAVDRALDGGYDVSSTLRFSEGAELLRLTVGVRDASLLAPAADAVASVLADAPALLAQPGVLAQARAHVSAAYDTARASLVALSEALTSFVANDLSIEAFENSGELIAATADDRVLDAARLLVPSRRLVVLRGVGPDELDAAQALITPTEGAR